MSEPDLNATFTKVIDPCTLNCQKSVDMNATCHLPPMSRSITPPGLNCTFSIKEGGSHHSVRAVSCDNVGDDDQFSSASDSSFSSGNRLMNVGDVQNIARLQEESKNHNPLKTDSSSCFMYLIFNVLGERSMLIWTLVTTARGILRLCAEETTSR